MLLAYALAAAAIDRACIGPDEISPSSRVRTSLARAECGPMVLSDLRTLETVEGNPSLLSNRLAFGEGQACRIARLRQSAPTPLATPLGSDHALVIDLRGTPDLKRWRKDRLIGQGSVKFSLATMSAGSCDTWQFERGDAVHVHVPHAVLQQLLAESDIGREGEIEVMGTLNEPDPSAHHLALAFLGEAALGSLSPLVVEMLGIAFARLLLGRYSNFGDHPRLTRLAALQSRPDNRRIGRAIEYVETHLGDPLSVKELAGVACLSTAHFSRAFRSTTGETVWSYVQRRRCERGMEMLRGTDLPIARIAHACGFASQAHLTRDFKAHFGVTPGRVPRR